MSSEKITVTLSRRSHLTCYIRGIYLHYEKSFRRQTRFGRLTWRRYLIFKYANSIVMSVLNSGVRKRGRERKRAVTEIRHIIIVLRTLSRRLMKCKCPSGISRFNQMYVYIYTTLPLFLVTLYCVTLLATRTAHSNAIYIYICFI